MQLSTGKAVKPKTGKTSKMKAKKDGSPAGSGTTKRIPATEAGDIEDASATVRERAQRDMASAFGDDKDDVNLERGTSTITAGISRMEVTDGRISAGDRGDSDPTWRVSGGALAAAALLLPRALEQSRLLPGYLTPSFSFCIVSILSQASAYS